MLSRPDITQSVTRGAIRLLQSLNQAVVAELPLPNSRRADLVGLCPKGSLTILEVKSGLADYQADQKWPDYSPYCDAFYFAVAPGFPTHCLPADTGLIVADGFGGAIVRPAQTHPLSGARRKALTLRFARIAAWRQGELDNPMRL
ncbi:MAG: DNA repair putative endonuclease MmcB [Asticcacaulis sp.]